MDGIHPLHGGTVPSSTSLIKLFDHRRKIQTPQRLPHLIHDRRNYTSSSDLKGLHYSTASEVCKQVTITDFIFLILRKEAAGIVDL